MANGYWQKLLRVNLDDGTITTETVPEPLLKQFLGGAALGAVYLSRETSPDTQAFSGDNRLVFSTGAFQGAPVPGGAKFSICSISPQTGTYADTAAGADWGPEFKSAGYDLLIIQGTSPRPVYLSINDDAVELKDAAHLWGLDSYDSIDMIRKEPGNRRQSILSIGPAGEKMVAAACLVVDKHSFGGRCGLGAVMGSKKLKAVAVHGTRTVPVHNPQEVTRLYKKHFRQIMDFTAHNGFTRHGTPGLCETAESLGDMPIKYWSGDTFTEGAQKLGAPNYTETLNAKPQPCRYCPIGCHRDIEFADPPTLAVHGAGPEYETLGMMGSCCLIDDPKVVAKANDIANRLGIDTISCGAMVAFAMQCHEAGWIDRQMAGTLSLEWGNAETLIELTRQIGEREGLGALFAEGTLRAADAIHPGARSLVVHNKGLDYPAHDPRACISLAPSYATGTRGACHFRGPAEDIEMGGFSIPELGIEKGIVHFFEPDNQSRVAVACQNLGVVVNSLVICMFMIDGGNLSLTDTLEIFNAITGWDYTVEQLMETGERGFNLQRMLNVRNGYDGTTDTLPEAMYVSATKGFRAGKTIPFKRLLDDYYKLRNWDANGSPGHELLHRLGLDVL